MRVTEEMMDGFRALTGDVNPLHVSEDYARAQGFAARVVYGMLVASFYSTLAGVYLPGRHCLLQEVSTQFCRPVFAGDVLTVSGTVAEKQDVARRIVIKAEIRNQRGEKVNRARITAGVMK